MLAEVLPLPTCDVRNIPQMLRNLAKDIEDNRFGGAHNLVWVLDTGNAHMEVGLMGQAVETGAVAYLLLGCAQHKIMTEMKVLAE